MPFVPVPKDLAKVKTKVAFNLTARQLICFGAGGLIGVPAYMLTRNSLGNEAAALLMIGLMLPFFLFGIYEKDGQPLEKVLGHFIRAQFLAPKVRPYQTDNLYAALERLNHHEKEVHAIAKTAGKAGKKSASRKKTAQKDKADLRDTIRLTPNAKLTSRQKRRLSASVQKAKRDGKIPRTAQQTIPYREMCRDGICVVSERFFTKQVQFYDINYQLAQNEDKNLIFENWCDFLNYLIPPSGFSFLSSISPPIWRNSASPSISPTRRTLSTPSGRNIRIC